MSLAVRFPFVEADLSRGQSSLLPYLPLSLTLDDRTVAVSGLLDTGATVNVLPYDIGVQLGADWDQQQIPVRLAGNLASQPARVLVLQGSAADFEPVRLAFAWTRFNEIPVILGQVNFFMEFDVCFFRSRSVFEIQPRQSESGSKA